MKHWHDKKEVAVLVVFKNENKEQILNCMSRASELPLNNPDLNITLIYDFRECKPHEETYQSFTARLKNKLVGIVNLKRYHYIMWLEADAEYPADLPTELIKANPFGVSAPLVFQRDRLYTSGFIEKGRSHVNAAGAIECNGKPFKHDSPYFKDYKKDKVVDVENVDYVYMLPVSVYSSVSHEDNAIADNYAICKYIREKGLPVTVHTGLKVNISIQ